jgi:hypothetical protein
MDIDTVQVRGKVAACFLVSNGRTMNGSGCEREAIVACVKLLLSAFPSKNEENYQKLSRYVVKRVRYWRF